MDLTFDNKFDEYPSLTWLPYVGDRYTSISDPNKILIVGESHYHDNTDKSIEAHKSANFTRFVVSDQAIGRNYWGTKLFPNFHRALMGSDDFDSIKLWNSLAFYNFIQRPMVTNQERPTKEDFMKGWDTFADVIKVLQPRTCIFLGVKASDTLWEAYKTSNLTLNNLSRDPKVNNTYPRKGTVTAIEGVNAELVFIKHPSKYFSPEVWHNFLASRIPEPLAYLKNQIS